MMRFTGVFATFLFVFLISFTLACGNGNKTASTPTTTVPTTPAPTSGGTSGTGGTGSPATAPDNFFAVMYQFAGRYTIDSGSVSVDATANNGAGTLQFDGGVANVEYQLQFCGWGSHFSSCTNLTAFTPTANAQPESVTFTMPKGNWSGFFQVWTASVGSYANDDIGQRSGLNFSAAMLPASSISGGTGMPVGSDNGSGTFVINGTTAQLKVTGAKPNQAYSFEWCAVDASPCTVLSSVTSDASGNINTTLDASKWGLPGLFALSDASGLEFVTGFRVQ